MWSLITFRKYVTSRVGRRYRRHLMAGGITESGVHAAADELLAKCKYPTVEQIRAHLAGFADQHDPRAGDLVKPTIKSLLSEQLLAAQRDALRIRSVCRSHGSPSNGTPGFGEPIEPRQRDSNLACGPKPWRQRNLSGKAGPSTSDLSRIGREAVLVACGQRWRYSWRSQAGHPNDTGALRSTCVRRSKLPNQRTPRPGGSRARMR